MERSRENVENFKGTLEPPEKRLELSWPRMEPPAKKVELFTPPVEPPAEKVERSGQKVELFRCPKEPFGGAVTRFFLVLCSLSLYGPTHGDSLCRRGKSLELR